MHGPRKWGTWDVKDVYPQIAAGCLGDGIGKGRRIGYLIVCIMVRLLDGSNRKCPFAALADRRIWMEMVLSA